MSETVEPGSVGDGGPRGSAGEQPEAGTSTSDTGNQGAVDAGEGVQGPYRDTAGVAESAGTAESAGPPGAADTAGSAGTAESAGPPDAAGSTGVAGAPPSSPWFGGPPADHAAAARNDREGGSAVATRVSWTGPDAAAGHEDVAAGDHGEDAAGGTGGPDVYAVESTINDTLQPLLLHSLAELREIWVPLLEAADVRSVAEIGSESGAATSLLVDLLRGRGGGKLLVVDPDPGVVPEPGGGLEVDVVRGYSPQALAGLAPADAYLIDGDHNYATATGELETIADAVRAAGRPHLPLLIMHDVGWPNGRRDSYYTPERIPEPARQPYSWDLGVRLDSTGVVTGGLRGEGAFAWARAEGGSGNGVRTAVEDFLASRPELRLFVAAPIFGLGVVVDDRAPYAGRVTELLRPWACNSLLTRLERNRLDLYLHVLLLQDEIIDAARRRQREWARLDVALADRAASELRLLD
ncbi:class I SAM-dependent methyltransferase, partial [Candidatus Protofrankia californiensis]|uniref:class I SAM-dependent methyltransferase n=1 Tax=Candidatus Protofrankia californiensis TaxID=1839754 RepID=UPI001F494852